ncbi:MAG: phosphoribosylaminoimidazole synthetase, partial [Dehalococcoidia bacterium SM23_28_2]
MPDVYGQGDFDLVGFIVGVVERGQIIDGSTIRAGDVLLGLPSSGLHTNGYSLARKVFGVGLRSYPGLEGTLGEALLAPHRCYYNELKPVLGRLKGIAHITGGGIPGNLPRILREGLAARLRRGSWPVPPIFRLIQERGKVAEEEMYRTFNMGLGLIVACAPEDAEAVRAQLPEALAVGEVIAQKGEPRAVIA